MTETITPTSFEEVAVALAGAAAARRPVRPSGAGTKLGWGASTIEPSLALSTAALTSTIEHNAGDLTAIFAAGVPLARARAELAEAGQMLSIDPPLGRGGRSDATIGGVFATADSGPLRHRYGAPRDLILGITVALSDGTVAKAGSKVIKNVAGYDLAKLFTGSFGTLGVILSVSVRLHPLPEATATAVGSAADPQSLASAAIALAGAPLELEALDVAWRDGHGGLLARVAGARTGRRAARIAALMRESGLQGVEVSEDDEQLWERQRAGQRSARHAIVRIAARPTQLPALLTVADSCEATLIGRVALGISYVELAPERFGTLRVGLPPGARAVVLDVPASVRGEIDRWGTGDGRALELMRELKHRFDPAAVCNPGVFVGGI